MTRIAFSIPIAVVAKQGDRSRIVTPRNGKQFVHHYQPKEVAQNAEALKQAMSFYRCGEPFDCPLRVALTFWFEWNKSETRKNRAKPSMPHAVKPDVDNLAKQVLDCLEAVGFFCNDSRIAKLELDKHWRSSPGLDVLIEEWSAVEDESLLFAGANA